METKHTKGKWLVYNTKYGTRLGIETENGRTIIVFGTNDDLCGVYGETEKEQQANSKLIAAAPELLEALIEVEEWAATFGLGYKQYEKVKNAIKKATE